jgi:hypothetical protein
MDTVPVVHRADHLGLGGLGVAPVAAGRHVKVVHASPYGLELQEAVDGLSARLAEVEKKHLLEDPWRRTSIDVCDSLHSRLALRGIPAEW